MGFTDVFGGSTIGPADRTYIALTFSADVTLRWPIEQQIGGDDVVADIMDLDATASGLNVDFPDARQVSNGYTSLFNNVGAETVTIRDASGATIISITPGSAWFVYLRDNSTEAGSWRTFQLGASVAVAAAAALAGAGLKAIGATLNQTMPPSLTSSTPVTLTDSARAQMTIWTGGVGVLDLPAAATVGADWFTVVRNQGSGNLTVTPPSGTIDDAASLVMGPGTSAIVVTDGTNWFSVGFSSGSAVSSFSFTTIDVSGSGNFVLSGANLGKTAYRFTGTLTGNRVIVVPGTAAEYWIDNQTSGAFTLAVGTSGQVSPPEVSQNNRTILYCDGSDVINADTEGSIVFPLVISQGGTGGTTASVARANLAVPPLTRQIITGATSGLNGGGDLSADRSPVLSVDRLTISSVIDIAADYIPMFDASVPGTRRVLVQDLLGVQITKVKTAETSRTSTTTLTDDPHLVGFVLQANTFYMLEAYFDWFGGNGGANPEIRFTTSQVLAFDSIGWWVGTDNSGTGTTGFRDQTAVGTSVPLPVDNSGFDSYVHGRGIIETGGSAPTLDFQWAQDVSDPVSLLFREGSWISFRKMT